MLIRGDLFDVLPTLCRGASIDAPLFTETA